MGTQAKRNVDPVAEEQARRTECFLAFCQIEVPGRRRRLGSLDPAVLRPDQCRAAIKAMDQIAAGRWFTMKELLYPTAKANGHGEIATLCWRGTVRALRKGAVASRAESTRKAA